MALTIEVAHDYNCPWCWIGMHQVLRLQDEFPDLTVEWLGFEQWPDELEWPESPPAVDENPNKPKTPSRLTFAYLAEGMQPPTVLRPRRMRTHNALEATEYAKEQGVGLPFIERLYRAFWEEGVEINRPDLLANLAQGIIPDPEEMMRAVEARRYAARIVGFDDAAYERGVFNLPTFFIDGVRYAEQPYGVLRKAVREAICQASEE